MMNQAIREEKKVTSSQFNFEAEPVQNNVLSDIIPAGKNAAVAIWGFFDITMHICFVRMVSTIVDSTCRPGSAWLVGIIRMAMMLELFESSRRKTAQYCSHLTEYELRQVDELIRYVCIYLMFSCKLWL